MSNTEKTMKGLLMNTLNSKKQTNKEDRFPYMTEHFVERYFEKIINKPKPKYFNKKIYNGIKKDMKDRMLDREMVTMYLFAKASEALLPMGLYNKVVIRSNTLITVY